jgi:protein subunit release factor A
MGLGAALLESVKEPLTQADVDEYLSVVARYEKWVTEDVQGLQKYWALPPAVRQAKLEEVFGEWAATAERLKILQSKVEMAKQASDPKIRAEMKKQITESEAKMAEAEANLAKLPPAMQAEYRARIQGGFQGALDLAGIIVNYPEESLAIFKASEAALDAGKKQLGELDKAGR